MNTVFCMAHARESKHELCKIAELRLQEEKMGEERRDGKEPEELGEILGQYLYLSKAIDSVRYNTREKTTGLLYDTEEKVKRRKMDISAVPGH